MRDAVCRRTILEQLLSEYVGAHIYLARSPFDRCLYVILFKSLSTALLAPTDAYEPRIDRAAVNTFRSDYRPRYTASIPSYKVPFGPFGN